MRCRCPPRRRRACPPQPCCCCFWCPWVLLGLWSSRPAPAGGTSGRVGAQREIRLGRRFDVLLKRRRDDVSGFTPLASCPVWVLLGLFPIPSEKKLVKSALREDEAYGVSTSDNTSRSRNVHSGLEHCSQETGLGEDCRGHIDNVCQRYCIAESVRFCFISSLNPNENRHLPVTGYHGTPYHVTTKK